MLFRDTSNLVPLRPEDEKTLDAIHKYVGWLVEQDKLLTQSFTILNQHWGGVPTSILAEYNNLAIEHYNRQVILANKFVAAGFIDVPEIAVPPLFGSVIKTETGGFKVDLQDNDGDGFPDIKNPTGYASFAGIAGLGGLGIPPAVVSFLWWATRQIVVAVLIAGTAKVVIPELRKLVESVTGADIARWEHEQFMAQVGDNAKRIQFFEKCFAKGIAATGGKANTDIDLYRKIGNDCVEQSKGVIQRYDRPQRPKGIFAEFVDAVLTVAIVGGVAYGGYRFYRWDRERRR